MNRTLLATFSLLTGLLMTLTNASTQTPASAQTPPSATVAPDNGKGPFLFSYFLGNGDGLHLAYSPDGFKFTPLNNDKPLLTPEIGSKLMRDPCLRQDSDGTWRLVWTTGWYDQGFGVSSSKDLVHWTDQIEVPAMKFAPTAKNTWAPELFFDDTKNEWLIFWASTIPGKFKETEVEGGDKSDGVILNHRMYYVTTKDFKTFSDTKLFYDPGFNCIDATIAKAGDNHYVMVIKDETKAPVARKNLRVATAENPQGPWSKASDPVTMDWVEGPTIAKVGDGWNIYYDIYRERKYGAVRTTDWKTFKVVDDELGFPKGARHGTVTPVTEEQLAALKKLGETTK
jgi:sucrose-6-phosphate hydrolase SacC (GH32 family)